MYCSVLLLKCSYTLQFPCEHSQLPWHPWLNEASWWFFIRSQLREATGDRCNSSIRAAASNILDFRFACGPQAEQRLDEQMLWLLDDKICFSFSLDLLKRGKPKYIPQYIQIIYAQMTLSVFSSPVQPNEGCLESLCHESNGQKFFDCLLLPGDLCTSEDLFEEVMGTLTAAFQKVFFCFGNHEAWTRGEKKGTSPAKDSFQKLERIHQICKTLGVYTTPVRIISGPKNIFLENHEPEPWCLKKCNFYHEKPWFFRFFFVVSKLEPFECCNQMVGGDDSEFILLLPLWSWYHSSWETWTAGWVFSNVFTHKIDHQTLTQTLNKRFQK